MKNFLSYLQHVPKKYFIILAAFITLAFPVVSTAQESVRIEADTGVANVTAGDTEYKDSVNAKVDEVVKLQVWYHNMEEEDSGKIAENLKVKVDMPTSPGKNQTINTTVSSDTSNTVTGSADVNLSLDRAHLEYVPGSAKFRHNVGTNDNPEWKTETVSDDIVNGGVVLEDAKPCFNYEATVTILARVKAPVVSITKDVRKYEEGQTGNWSKNVTINPGDKVEYLITVKNEGNQRLDDVVVGDNLPKYMSYVEGTTKLKNGNYPNGTDIENDNIVNGGINIGSYNPGAVAYVWFTAKADTKNVFEKCGKYKVVNEALVKTDELGPYYNTAYTTIDVECAEAQQPQPSFACEDLTKEKLSKFKYEFTARASVENAEVEKYVFHFGDGSSEEVVTDQTEASVEHTYTEEGNYTAYVIVHTTEGETERINECEVSLAVEKEEQPPEEEKPPVEELPRTGPLATAVAVFGGSSTVAYLAGAYRRSRKALLEALLGDK